MFFTKEYWNSRADKYGHTGHSEPFYYCFDQQARLYAVDTALKNIHSKKNTALDFGCGSGDFLDLLKSHYQKVYGFDISDTVIRHAKKRFMQKDVLVSNNTEEVFDANTFDLILTVTVLQSLDKEELENTLQTFYKLLAEGGTIICLEFFISVEYAAQSKSTLPTYNDLFKALAKAKFKIVETRNFYNPVVAPSKSWIKYKNNWFIKTLSLFKHFTFAQNYLSYVSKKLILDHKDVLPTTETGFKLFSIEKVNSDT